jgi:hypothetical protein
MAPYRIYPQVREIRMGPWICGRQKKGVGPWAAAQSGGILDYRDAATNRYHWCPVIASMPVFRQSLSRPEGCLREKVRY